MYRTRFLVIPLVLLIFICLLFAGGLAIHRIGWSEGYRVGLLASDGVPAAAVPSASYGTGFFGLLLVVGIFFLLLAVIMKAIGFSHFDLSAICVFDLNWISC